MTNKVIIGILIFLVLLSGSLGYYSYSLSQQIDSLSEHLAAFQTEQAVRIVAVTDEITSLRGETQKMYNTIEDTMGETVTRVSTLEGDISETSNRVGTVENRISGTLSRIDTLENVAEGVATELSQISQSTIDASEVYQRVIQATVRISNGERTVGSGFIFDTEGHVVTAHHVVENLTSIYVILPDGRISKATNTGSSRQSDIAVLTLENGLDTQPLVLADSDMVKIGEPVAVIGSPFDLTETLTAGIVSQTNRFTNINYDSQSRWVANLIQFDAAVNSGNSGGPLVNSAGEVIGLVIARVNPDEGDGIYYAVSSNKVRRVSASLITQGSFDYPWIGVTVSNLTPIILQSRNLETVNGALVREVVANSPAMTAGIKIDDIIVAIDGIEIGNVAELVSYLGEYKRPGEAATIAVIRNATKLEISLEIGEQP